MEELFKSNNEESNKQSQTDHWQLQRKKTGKSSAGCQDPSKTDKRIEKRSSSIEQRASKSSPYKNPSTSRSQEEHLCPPTKFNFTPSNHKQQHHQYCPPHLSSSMKNVFSSTIPIRNAWMVRPPVKLRASWCCVSMSFPKLVKLVRIWKKWLITNL